jgi:hypothetical protein
MFKASFGRGGLMVLGLALGSAVLLSGTGCLSGGSGWDVVGNPFPYFGSGAAATGPTQTGTTAGGQLGQDTRSYTDPCSEPQPRKYVRISMRNYADIDYIHYFFVAIAFVAVDGTDPDAIIPTFDGEEFPNGAVCPNDISLYVANGYESITAGRERAFGDYCIGGPALVYFHRNGQFRTATGTGSAGLGSAIAPAQGTLPTYDSFFDSVGALLPAPDLIVFHNPGVGEGAPLKISVSRDSPCDPAVVTLRAAPPCQRDSFYYVAEDGFMAGVRTLGSGSGRRVPDEIQGTGCECNPLSGAYQILAPSGATATTARCDEFLRGGRITYTFIRDDQTPAFPQLLWRVTDATGSIAHDYDSRATLPGGG